MTTKKAATKVVKTINQAARELQFLFEVEFSSPMKVFNYINRTLSKDKVFGAKVRADLATLAANQKSLTFDDLLLDSNVDVINGEKARICRLVCLTSQTKYLQALEVANDVVEVGGKFYELRPVEKFTASTLIESVKSRRLLDQLQAKAVAKSAKAEAKTAKEEAKASEPATAAAPAAKAGKKTAKAGKKTSKAGTVTSTPNLADLERMFKEGKLTKKNLAKFFAA